MSFAPFSLVLAAGFCGPLMAAEAKKRPLSSGAEVMPCALIRNPTNPPPHPP